MGLVKIFKEKCKDPLFYIGLITFGYWLADAYLKIFILEAPSRVLWYSAVGLLITSIGLFIRSSLLLTAMFCALVINETLWTISFFSNLFFRNDITNITDYAFKPNYPIYKFIITMYHLTIIPALTIGLLTVRKIHKFGWLAAGIFALTVGILAFIFPDPKGENVNCVQRETIGSCKLYFSYFYRFDGIWRAFLVPGSLTLLIYLPINYILLFLAKRLGWHEHAT